MNTLRTMRLISAIRTNRTLLPFVFCALVFALSAWAMREQAQMHAKLKLDAEPALYRSQIAAHEAYLQSTAFRSQRLGELGPKQRDAAGVEQQKYRCRMPAYDIRWRQYDLNINRNLNTGEQIGLRNSAAACVDIRVSDDPASKSRLAPSWIDFGERIRVLPVLGTTRSNLERRDPADLRYADGTPILPSTIRVHVEPRAASGQTLTVELSSDATETCHLIYQEGQLRGCGWRRSDTGAMARPEPQRPVKVLSIDTDRDGKPDRVASVSFDQRGRLRLEGKQWAQVAGTSDAATLDFELPCDIGRARSGTASKRFGVGQEDYGLRVWCESHRAEAASEAQRLAQQASKRVRFQNPQDATIRTSLDAQLDARLNQILRERCADCEVLVMDTLRGAVLAMASGRTAKDRHTMPITNFELRRQGSMVKPIYATAVLEKTAINGFSPLLSLKMKAFQPDYFVGTGDKAVSMSCRVANGAIVRCRRDAKGGYVTLAKKNLEYDFYRFMVRSENTYATTLLYLGSSRAWKPEDGDCNKTFALLPKNPEVPSWGLTIGGEDVSEWVAKRVPLFSSPALDRICFDNGMLPWLSWLREHAHITGDDPIFRSYIWRDQNGSTPSNTELRALAPELEHGSLLRKELELRSKGFIESETYKSAYGGGDAAWSNLGLAEAISTVVSGNDQEASLLAHARSAKPRTSPLSPSRLAVIKGMAGVVGDPQGTANRYFQQKIEVCGPPPLACLRSPKYGLIRILAKTGTPKDEGVAINRSRVETGFASLVEEASFSGLCKPFKRNDSTCTLSDDGERLFDTIKMAYANSRIAISNPTAGSTAAGNTATGKATTLKAAPRLDESALRTRFRNWLSDHIRASDSDDASPADSEANSQTRLVVVLLQSAQNAQAQFSAGCTLVMTSESKGKQQTLADVVALLLQDETLLRSCQFTPTQVNPMA